MPTLDVGKDGTIYLVWMDYNVQTGGQGVIFLDRSTDGGVSWGTDIPVDTIGLPPLHLNMNTGARAKGAPVIRVMPSDPMHLILVYAEDPDGTGPDEADIFLRTSTDGGNTWPMAAKIRVNDDPGTCDQILPWVSIKKNDIIDIAWYDKRNDVNDVLFDVFYTYSIDKGMSFAPNVKANQLPFIAPFVPKTGDNWFGEYLGLAADYNMAYIVYSSSYYDQLGDVIFSSMPNPAPYKDYGDAPEPSFPVMSINSGASHIYVPNVFLGNLIDTEPDGLPDANATGDNNHNVNDEDGVIIPAPLLIGQLDTIRVVASTTGFLNAWIDYNGNGSWADPGEQVYTDQVLVAGTNYLPVLVPGGTAEISTYARFRFCTMAGVSFTGEAPDGEVEDYMVTLDDQTGINIARDNTSKIELFPNPASDIMHIRIREGAGQIMNISINDILGNVVMEIDNAMTEQMRVGISGMPEGLYLLRLQSGNKVLYSKFLVVR